MWQQLHNSFQTNNQKAKMLYTPTTLMLLLGPGAGSAGGKGNSQAARVNHTVFLCNAMPIPSPCSPLNETIIPSHCLWRTPALAAALYTPKSPPAGQSKGLASLFKKHQAAADHRFLRPDFSALEFDSCGPSFIVSSSRPHR